MVKPKHYQAFLDFCRGMSLNQLSKKHDVSVSTISKWKVGEEWEAAKESLDQAHFEYEVEKNRQLADSIYERYVEKAQDCIDLLLDYTKLGLTVVAEEQLRFYQGESPKYDLKRQAEIARVGKMLAESFKFGIPHVSEELGEAMANDLRKILQEQEEGGGFAHYKNSDKEGKK